MCGEFTPYFRPMSSARRPAAEEFRQVQYAQLFRGGLAGDGYRAELTEPGLLQGPDRAPIRGVRAGQRLPRGRVRGPRDIPQVP